MSHTFIESWLRVVGRFVSVAIFKFAKVGRIRDMSSVVLLLFVWIFSYHVMTKLHGSFGFYVLFVEEIYKDVSVSLNKLL